MSTALACAFPALAVTTSIGVPLYAWRVRGRGYAIFGFVVLLIALPGALIMHPRLVTLAPEAVVAISLES